MSFHRPPGRTVTCSVPRSVAVMATFSALFALAACGEDGVGSSSSSTDAGPGGGASTSSGRPSPAASGAGGGDGGSTSGSGGQGAASGAGGEGGAEPVLVPGLRADYFADYLDLVVSRVEPSVDVVWGAAPPDPSMEADRWSTRWSGFLTPPEDGLYTIATENDDGVRVFVDGQLLIDDWRGHFVTRNEATIELRGGEPVPIRVDYFEIDLEAQMRLSWSTSTRPEEVIGAPHLSTYDVAPSLPSPKPPYTNPVIPFDCPDPGVVATPESDPPGFVAVCTGGPFPIRTSRSLLSWSDTGAFVLPEGKPAWAANGGRNWAPEIHRVGEAWVAYFTSVNGANVLSIGAASAPSPTGPYTDRGAPLVEHPDGVIDASYFEDDDGSRWLTYKIDGNAHGRATPIFIRRLAPDGLSFAEGSSATQILSNDGGTWEGGVVEAQWIVKREGTYFLFYSGNVYDHRYRTGVARAASLLGPYEKHGAPILANNEAWVGPGHGSIVTVGERDLFVYHAWHNAGDGTNLAAQGRKVLVDAIRWEGGWPRIHDGTPSRSSQPWPGEAM